MYYMSVVGSNIFHTRLSVDDESIRILRNGSYDTTHKMLYVYRFKHGFKVFAIPLLYSTASNRTKITRSIHLTLVSFPPRKDVDIRFTTYYHIL